MKDQIVTLITCPYSRAQLIKGKLESEGIECFLSNTNLIQPGIASGVKVKIHETDSEEAYRILEEIKNQTGSDKIEVLKKLKDIRRILVPVDFSEYSLNACNFAVSLAGRLKAEIKLLYTYYNPIVGSEPYLEGQPFNVYMDQVIGNIEYDAKRHLQELKHKIIDQVREENLKNIKINYSLDRGSPEESILHYIDRYKPGVVVMGTKGTGGSSSDFFGSVTRKVIEKADVPILAIPQKSVYSEMKHVNRVLYASNFEESDFKSLRKLMTLVRPFNMKIFCAHISLSDQDPLEKTKMEKLKQHFEDEYQDYEIYCDIISHEDIVKGLEKYIDDQEIDLLAVTTHKRGIIERLFNPSIAREMLFHSHIPLLIFHS